MGLNLDAHDWKTKDFATEVLQKSTFAEVGISRFQDPFFMILGVLATNFHVDLIISCTRTCYLACLVASLWRPGRPLGRFLVIGDWGAQERTLSGPGLDFDRFVVDVGIPF